MCPATYGSLLNERTSVVLCGLQGIALSWKTYADDASLTIHEGYRMEAR